MPAHQGQKREGEREREGEGEREEEEEEEEEEEQEQEEEEKEEEGEEKLPTSPHACAAHVRGPRDELNPVRVEPTLYLALLVGTGSL